MGILVITKLQCSVCGCIMPRSFADSVADARGIRRVGRELGWTRHWCKESKKWVDSCVYCNTLSANKDHKESQDESNN